jgi:hypothetical protein
LFMILTVVHGAEYSIKHPKRLPRHRIAFPYCVQEIARIWSFLVCFLTLMKFTCLTLMSSANYLNLALLVGRNHTQMMLFGKYLIGKSHNFENILSALKYLNLFRWCIWHLLFGSVTKSSPPPISQLRSELRVLK